MVQYFLSGMAVIILSWTLTGCRFGNQVDKNSKPDPRTGWYETHIQSLDFTATHARGTIKETASVDLVPDELYAVMTYPVIFWTNPSNWEEHKIVSGYLDPNQYNFDISIDSDQKITFEKSSSMLAENTSPPSACQIVFIFLGKGQLVPDKHAITVEDQEIAALGSLEMDFNRLIQFAGDCEQELNRMMWCYKDIKACELQGWTQPGGRQDALRSFFGPYIQSGVMTPDDIESVSEIGYEAVYR